MNPTKCKSFCMTLKLSPVKTTYFIGNTALEHVNTIRDLGVILDAKLTFGPHIQHSVLKANRALGILIRSFQKACPRGHFNRQSVLASYYAHVRSLLEYGCVIWGGAAAVHTDRIDRIQHKFLIWLNAHVAVQSPSISYSDLMSHFKVNSLAARRTQHDIMFLRSIFSGRIDSPFLLGSFSLAVPARVTRQQALFNIPYARVNTIKKGLYVRLPQTVNMFLSQCARADLFCDTLYSFRALVIAYMFS